MEANRVNSEALRCWHPGCSYETTTQKGVRVHMEKKHGTCRCSRCYDLAVAGWFRDPLYARRSLQLAAAPSQLCRRRGASRPDNELVRDDLRSPFPRSSTSPNLRVPQNGSDHFGLCRSSWPMPPSPLTCATVAGSHPKSPPCYIEDDRSPGPPRGRQANAFVFPPVNQKRMRVSGTEIILFRRYSKGIVSN